MLKGLITLAILVVALYVGYSLFTAGNSVVVDVYNVAKDVCLATCGQ